MKQFSAIVALAAILGTMYGYVLGQLASRPPHPPQSPTTLAPEYPSFLLEGDIWGQIIFWSALPLFILFAWLTIKFVGQNYLRDQKARLQEDVILQMDELFKEASALVSSGKGHSRETEG